MADLNPDRLNAIPIERLAMAVGVVLDGEGGTLTGRCPFDDGVLTIDPPTNTWSCSRCSTTGGAASFLAKVEGISEELAAHLLASVAPNSPPENLDGHQGLGVGVPNNLVLDHVVAYYARTLADSPDALTYLQRRGITSTEAIATFKVGFSNRTLAHLLPAKYRRDGMEVREQLQRLGVLRQTGHEHLAGSVVVPLFSAEGQLLNVYGRKITPNLREGTELHTWIDSKRTGLFNVAAFAASTTIIVAGSILDALILWSNGHRHVTAVHGFDGPLDELLAAVEKHGTHKILVAFRRSKEGDVAAESLASKLTAFGVEVLRVVFPSGMDVGDFVTATANPQEALARVIRSAEWISGTTTATTTSTATAPVTTPASPPSTTTADTLVYTFEDRRWRIRGLGKTTPQSLKVNVLVNRDGAAFHVDLVELYSARQRASFTRMAADELGLDEQILKRDLGHVLLRLEHEQDDMLRRGAEREVVATTMSDEDREAALAALRDLRLVDRILDDFEQVGVVGERDNLLVGYLAAVSRMLDHPLAVVVQSSSAAGKSSLMEAVLSFVPDEHRLSFSAMTGQALYYMSPSSLKHRVLSIAEEAGAERAAYALKLLQSEGALTIASTGKEPATGRLVSQEYRVEGPVAIMMTTTAIDVDDELLSRCIVLSVDEGPEQTSRIQARQRAEMTLDGRLRRRDRGRLLTLHQNMQRLLRPLVVVNPYIAEMEYGDHRVRARRDHLKLLGLVEALALVHQHQRPVKTIEHAGHVVEYIEVTAADIDAATKLMTAVGAAGLDDLPPHTMRLLGQLDALVKDRATTSPKKHVRFTRREVREALGLGDTQAKIHLRRLVESEYVIAHAAPHGRGLVYELAVEAGMVGGRAADGRGSGGPRSGHGRPPSNGDKPAESGREVLVERGADEIADPGPLVGDHRTEGTSA